jgi:5'-nucleotidase/UDP-sugar diphosphatase
MAIIDYLRSKYFCYPHGLVYTALAIILTGLVITTAILASLWSKSGTKLNGYLTEYAVVNGIIGFPPRLPNDGRYVQWTFLHMNDVYELLPLDNGRKGGLARVAYMRQLLLNENNNTITVLAGDLVSPSALGTAIVNGTALNGKQMIATMNTLGLDYMTFGNHEFDLSEPDLLARMNESTFTWISSNVFRSNSSQPFGSSITHKLITIDTVRILIIAYTIDETGDYIRYINQSSLVNYTNEFLTSFPNGTYDVLVALTHLDIATDVLLAANVPQINLIMGGHEHEDYYYLRGTTYTPIYKADANAFTVYIHRCAFNVDTKRFRIYNNLARVTSEMPEEPKTAAVANYWFTLGIQGFEALGYEPFEVVSCLPAGVELDGRYESVTTSVTLLSEAICEGLIQTTATFGTTIGLLNGGTIRVDDILRGTITQYDVLRTLPYIRIILWLFRCQVRFLPKCLSLVCRSKIPVCLLIALESKHQMQDQHGWSME